MLSSKLFFASLLLSLLTLAGCSAQPARAPIAGLTCPIPPAQRCPDANCPTELVTATGEVVDPATGRKFFLDYPCDLKPNEKVTFVLNLHGGGSFGNWQRHYFPIVDFKDQYRLVIATPNAPPRVWAATDDAHLQNIVNMVHGHFGSENIQAFWLAGHSQGGMTSRRIVCTDFFADQVTGFISLSGGRIGGTPSIAEGFMRPRPDGTGAARATPTPRLSSNPPLPACDFSHIYTTGEHEISGPIPAESPWADKYNCDAKVFQADIVDTKAGYVFDGSRQDPATKAWGRLPAGGVAKVGVYPNCEGGRVVADVSRIDKGHTEGLEPNVTEAIVQLMLSTTPAAQP